MNFDYLTGDFHRQFQDDTRVSLLVCLEDLEAEGDFFSCHRAGQYVNPGLNVHGVGSISLPVSQKDAQAVTAVCQQAPFGRKDETIIDTSVRRTWELDSNQFECQNPSWPGFLESLTQQATSALGVHTAARAELYKLLLYEEGAFFKPHKDSEKVPGMFGTMVVCLPSHHEGGEVRLSHAGKSTTLVTSTASQFDITTLAWYSDVTHEIKPITSGYRLVLTYNLVQHENHHKQSASLLGTTREQLATCLRNHHGSFNGPKDCFIHLLHHKYTEPGLELSKLKGHDAIVGKYLNNMMCEEGGRHINLDLVTTPQGRRIAWNIEVDQSHLLDDELFAGDCDSQDEGGYTGNEGMEVEMRYHSTVAMLVPKSNFAAFFLSNSQDNRDLNGVVEYIAEDLQTYPSGMIEQAVAGQVLNLVQHHVSSPDSSRVRLRSYPQSESTDLAPILPPLYTIANQLQRTQEYYALLQHVPIPSPLSSELVGFLASQIVKDMSQNLEKSLIWNRWLTCIFSGVKNVRGLKGLYTTIASLSEQLVEPTINTSFQQYAHEQTSRVYGSIQSFEVEDIDAAINLVMHQSTNSKEQLISIIDRCGKRSSVLLFLTRLWGLSTNTDLVSTTYVTLMRNRERLYPRPQAEPGYPYSYVQGVAGDLTTTATTAPIWWPVEEATMFVKVLTNLWSLDRPDLVRDLITHMDLKLNLDQNGGHRFWDLNSATILRFIADFTRFLEERRDQKIVDYSKKAVLSTLQAYAQWVLDQVPHPPTTWARESESELYCFCPDCHVLKNFLRDPNAASIQFTMNKKKRTHVERSLIDSRWYQLTTTKPGRGHGQSQTLTITKTSNEYEDRRAKWEGKLEGFRTNLVPLRRDFVQQMLGPVLFQQLVLLDMALIENNGLASTAPAVPPAGIAPPPIQPLRPSTTAENRSVVPPPPQVAGTKRKIDSTGR